MLNPSGNPDFQMLFLPFQDHLTHRRFPQRFTTTTTVNVTTFQAARFNPSCFRKGPTWKNWESFQVQNPVKSRKPIGSMYGIFTYIYHEFMVNV